MTRRQHKRFQTGKIIAFCLLFFRMVGSALAGSDDQPRQIYLEAKHAFDASKSDPVAAWTFARACFDLADAATNNTERAAIAEQGIAACRLAISRDPNSAPAHYYLGMNLAQIAQTKGIGALKVVDEMEKEFTTVRNLDPQYDFAGADRNLGLLYRDAPSWISVGDKKKARQHLKAAVDLAPDYPENNLNLIESDLKWDDLNGARRQVKALEDHWTNSVSILKGPHWSSSWKDWRERYAKAKKKLNEPSKALASPRAGEH